MTDQRHMSKNEFDKFIEVYKQALDDSQIDVYNCNEAREQSLRSLATYMWDAGRMWEDIHGNDGI